MNDGEFRSSMRGYIYGRAFSNTLNSNLENLHKELARKNALTTSVNVISAEVAKLILSDNKQGAYQYLNTCFMDDIISIAMNQRDFIYSLETMIQRQKDKFSPFYKRIEMEMPEKLQTIKADELCQTLGVENLHIIDSVNGKTSPSLANDNDDPYIVIKCVIMIIAILVIIIIYLL